MYVIRRVIRAGACYVENLIVNTTARTFSGNVPGFATGT